MDSKIASMLYESMGTQQREARRVPDSTRRAFLSRMRLDAVTARQGAQNMEDAVSMVTTAQTGVTAIKHMLGEMRKLAVDASNLVAPTQAQYDAYTAQLRDYAKRLTETAETTQFNGFRLLDGSAGLNNDGVFQLQAGDTSVREVLVNLLNPLAADVLDGEKTDLRKLETKFAMSGNADALAALDLINKVFERMEGVEARYSTDIKSLDNLRVLLESRGDIFDNARTYHEENAEQTQSPQNYLDLLMSTVRANGNIFMGKG
ncbi:MAG: hypothetical protein LBC94_07820 [Desulfovibrio sp.]|jgi:flagellin|nr:hypothetical protein [Desulfovibrio sp.]